MPITVIPRTDSFQVYKLRTIIWRPWTAHTDEDRALDVEIFASDASKCKQSKPKKMVRCVTFCPEQCIHEPSVNWRSKSAGSKSITGAICFLQDSKGLPIDTLPPLWVGLEVQCLPPNSRCMFGTPIVADCNEMFAEYLSFRRRLCVSYHDPEQSKRTVLAWLPPHLRRVYVRPHPVASYDNNIPMIEYEEFAQ